MGQTVQVTLAVNGEPDALKGARPTRKEGRGDVLIARWITRPAPTLLMGGPHPGYSACNKGFAAHLGGPVLVRRVALKPLSRQPGRVAIDADPNGARCHCQWAI